MFITKKIKKCIILNILLCIPSLTFANIPDAPSVKAKSYVLMDYDTGDILDELNPDTILPPASLTKVMTAYVVFNELERDNLKLTDTVRISKKAWKTSGSKTFIKEGDDVLVEDLIKGMIIHSGNDASVALAEHIAGSVERFSELMNYEAKNLKMENSHFENPTGLPIKNHYTTARDLSILTRAMIQKFPKYYYIYQLKQFTYADITQQSRNRLLKEDLGFDGLKTGYTNAAGYCYIGSAKRDDRRLIVTLMGEPSPEQRFEDAKSLVNFGFRFYEKHTVLEKNKAIEELTTQVYNGVTDNLYIGTNKDVVLVLERGQINKIKYDVDLIKVAKAPIESNQKVGTIKVMLNDTVLETVDLINLNEIKEGSWVKKIKDYMNIKLRKSN